MTQIRNLAFTLVIGLISSLTSLAQKEMFSLNQFEINTFTGGGLVDFNQIGGNDKFENQITPLYGLRFQYNRLINRKFQLNAALGFGTQAFTYALPESSLNDFTMRENIYNSFQELYLGARYCIPLENSFSFGLNFGAGLANYTGNVQGISGSSSFADGTTIELMDIEYRLNSQPVAFLEIGPQISRTFENKNELSLKLSYVQRFGNFYEGDYRLFNNTSYGTFSSSGSSFRLTLGYTFTGDRRALAIAEFNEELTDYKAAKNEFKRNKRFIHPESMFISLFGGYSMAKSNAQDQNDLITDEFGGALSTRVMVEKGWKKNSFVEAGYQLFEYNVSFGLSNRNFSSTKNEYFTHQFNLGAGYRVIGKRKNYHYFNLHGGLSIGFIPLRKGEMTWPNLPEFENPFGSIGTIGNTFSYQYTLETEVVSSFILAPYIGISKDFRITHSMFISILYRYQHGLNNISETRITYEDNQTYTTPITENTYMNGTEHTFQIGLKFKLGQDPK